ncbi:unnamed protein product [Paramecium primaurelia]|uniref:C3H1-type domain-containing protein n=1 Tax=Paramecium primaurelia TaxID=5886 RepID=A0A8S1MTX8_PARPR|nr:unnamed protein product [Paramecium primaurelia]
MAGGLERVYGTEEDKVNCSFYIKIGACRYENKCQRIHSIPPISQTILFKHMYQNSPMEVAIASGNAVSQAGIEEALEKFENFYEDVFLKLAEFGEIEDLIVCENIGDHLVGNVYVKYTSELYAESCFNALQNLSYENRPLSMEYSPVLDFSSAKCKQYIDGTCQRGGSCNYLHLKKISTKFKKSLFNQMYEEHPEYREKKEKEVNEKSPKKHKKKEKKSKKKKTSSSRESSRRNSIERQKMINDWNETGIQNVSQAQKMMYGNNMPAPVYTPKVSMRTSPELLQLQLQLAALKEQLAAIKMS